VIRILVTDDSVFMRSAIGRALDAEPDLEVVGKAVNGRAAVELAAKLRPHVITMDIEMPEMDGLTALRRIMRQSPTRVLMCSTLTQQGSRQSLQALRMGAADVIPKETSPDPKLRQRFIADLVTRVRALGTTQKEANAEAEAHAADPPPPRVVERAPVFKADRFDLVCIASSTGGPPVLETLVTALQPGLGLPVVIAQHMPRLFTESMARRLNEICPLPVVHAETGVTLQADTVYVVPGGQHAHLERASLTRRRLRLGPDPADAVYMPSADVLFETAAEVCGRRVLGVILTGIGSDGQKGAARLHTAGAPILAQSRQTCVVYGMPRAVVEAGYATAQLDPEQIAQTLAHLHHRAAA
jgi:two-component system chemotaxis response regulator CheB